MRTDSLEGTAVVETAERGQGRRRDSFLKKEVGREAVG